MNYHIKTFIIITTLALSFHITIAQDKLSVFKGLAALII